MLIPASLYETVVCEDSPHNTEWHLGTNHFQNTGRLSNILQLLQYRVGDARTLRGA